MASVVSRQLDLRLISGWRGSASSSTPRLAQSAILITIGTHTSASASISERRGHACHTAKRSALALTSEPLIRPSRPILSSSSSSERLTRPFLLSRPVLPSASSSELIFRPKFSSELSSERLNSASFDASRWDPRVRWIYVFGRSCAKAAQRCAASRTSE